MSYNFIYQIGSNSEIYSTNYDSKEECNVAQSKWMSDEKVKNSVLSIKIKSCGDYNADDGIIPPVYNINANAEQIKANNKDNTASLDKGVQVPHYTLLEPINGVRSIPITPTSFADYIQSTFNVLFGIFIVWSIFRLAYGGVLFMTSDIINKKLLGKEMIINSIKYFFLAVFTYTIFFIINPDILNNKITNIVKDGAVAVGSGVMDVVKNNSGGALGSGGSGVGVGGVGGSGSVSGRACDNVSLVIEKVKTSKDICSNTTCSKTCKFSNEIISTIKKEAAAAGIDYKIILAISCRESSGNVNAIGNHANNGYADCGLMQINMKSKIGVSTNNQSSNYCSPEIMNLENNIKEGIKLYKSKLSTARNYNRNIISLQSQALASYNCCSNGENPNDKSASCTVSTGFVDSIPKWACPIDPGTASFNMCNVRNYACDVTACIDRY